MIECAGENYMLNGAPVPVGQFVSSLVYEGDSLYEVIRIVNGTPLFFHDHMERLANTARLQGKDLLADEHKLREIVLILIKCEKISDANVKIVFNYNDTRNYLVYLIPTAYPTQEQYLRGVKGILYFAERKDPESKVIDQKLRSSILSKMEDEDAYEALLVNEKNEITEGSRSNIFFLKNETLVTAPENVVLNGITRKKILEICREIKLDVKFECVKIEEIDGFDGIFMTGTSPIVLPFFGVDDHRFKINYAFTEKLRMLYLEKAQASTSFFNMK